MTCVKCGDERPAEQTAQCFGCGETFCHALNIRNDYGDMTVRSCISACGDCDQWVCSLCASTHECVPPVVEVAPVPKSYLYVRGDAEGQDKTTGAHFSGRRKHRDLQKSWVDQQNAKNDAWNEKHRSGDGPGRPTDLYVSRGPYD